jgi:hypothetical protein
MSWVCTDGVVQFDYQIWASVFPGLAASIREPAAQIYWAQAGLYCENSPTSLIPVTVRGGQPVRAMILGLITAHLATLFGTINGSAPSGLVGRVASAAEGSVNVAVDMPGPMSAAWFNTTSFGAAAWQAMGPYRNGLYIAAPQIPLGAQSLPGFGPIYLGARGWPR